MSGQIARRASGQSQRQRLGLAALAKARHSYPTQGTGELAAGEVPMLAALASIESAISILRLGRLSAGPDDDRRWRILIVVAGALARAITDDLVSGEPTAAERLYRVISTMQLSTRKESKA